MAGQAYTVTYAFRSTAPVNMPSDTAGFQLGFRPQRYTEYDVTSLDVARYRAAWDCMVARHAAQLTARRLAVQPTPQTRSCLSR